MAEFKTYLFTECYSLLNCDPKTFRKWLKKAGLDASAQKSTIDERIKFLTEDQLRQLAQDHGRPWPPQPRPAGEQPAPIAPGAFKLVDERTGRHEHIISQHADQLAEHGRLLADAILRINQLEQSLSAATEQITGLTILTSKQARQIQELQEQIATARPRTTRRPASDDTDQTGEISELEPGLVGAAEFAEIHGVNVGTAKSAWQSGRIPTRRGKWRGPGRNPITIALDAQGRAVFYQLYSSNSSFQACPDCPHKE